MAGIDIEKKKPVWPSILLGLLIIAAIIAFFLWVDADEDDDIDDVEAVGVEETDSDANNDDTAMLTSDTEGTIADYAAFLDEDVDMGIGHEYTHSALTRLIEAVQQVADDLNVDVDTDMAEAKTNANDIMENPMEVDHANKNQNGRLRTRTTRCSEKWTTLSSTREPRKWCTWM